MGKKLRQLLEGKHRHHRRSEMGESTAYVVIHDICTDKTLSPEQKVKLIDGFCQDRYTIEEVASFFKNEAMSDI